MCSWLRICSKVNVFLDSAKNNLVFLTIIDLEVGRADGLSRSIGGNAGVGAGVLCAHVHQDEAVLAP